MNTRSTALFLLLAGCASFDSLRSRAAFDLRCPAEAIEAEWYEVDRTAVATGCGRNALYVNHCAPYVGCNWLLNSEVREAPAGTPAPATATPTGR